jgi:hypothetical protein
MSIPSPAVPASTTKVANNTGQYAQVTLAGFTSTFVYSYDQSGNQVQIGTTNGTYLLPPGYSISITYSVVGTWTWLASYEPYQFPSVYAAENLITAQASPNSILQQPPVGSTSRSLAGGTGCWSGTGSSTGLAMGVSN